MFEYKSLSVLKSWPLFMLVLLCSQSLAAEQLRVNRFFFDTVAGQIQISCQIEYNLDEKIIQALENGIAINFQTTYELLSKRKVLPDKVILKVDQRFAIKYYALIKQYIVREPALRAERSFVSLQSALAFIGRADRLSLGYVTSITAEANYYLRARSRLINGELPLPLRVQSYFTKDWRPVSDWRIIEVVKDGA